ncbi:acyl-CoA dehydratase activase-related protein [Variovorax sp. LjRoot84]|uniref:BadF/BadG/BcrA/BcrD ATPase family protein n=1 Tax=Variovorax sp. LjRoot84 TaxID=3342340 RepID=UPI003ECCA447
MADALLLGIDVGSTTVKTVAVDAASRRILWSDYRRHEARQVATVARQLSAVQERFPHVDSSAMRAFITGSGAGPLIQPLGAKFVQEVNAVTIAVDVLHPEAGSVIELGGQDAKIIIYKKTSQAGERRVIASMNDKCASGTGATIDKCVIKVGMQADRLGALAWNPDKLHPVAAKCGVFAETDIVGLLKSGIPAAEVMCSLADAIVMQNLSVLTRGHTLQHRVLLLGGPNTYLPFLQGCWRQRILEVWQARGYDYPRDLAADALVFVPANAELYAAYGAAVYGLQEPEEVGRFRGLDALAESMREGPRRERADGPPLVASEAERDAFVERYRVPAFVPAVLSPGQKLRGYIGIDGGSTSSKAVLLDEEGEVLCKHYQLSQGNPIADAKQIFASIRAFAADQGASLEVLGVGATGYAADILEETIGADANIVETVAHMISATRCFSDADVICDVGGQDIKVLFMEQGRIRNFRLSNQCSAGNGMLLQAMASQFGVPMRDYAELAFEAKRSPTFNYGCAVFLDTDRVNFQREGYRKEELMAGLALVLPKNIWQYVVQMPRLAQLGRVFVLQGGTQHNLAAVKAQHDYIVQRVPDAVVRVHPHCGEAGAIGAALDARRATQRRGFSSFIGLEAAIGLAYTTRNDESTVCHFCPNACRRTFIDAMTPQGKSSRYIAGFSCENGTVESRDALKTLALHRKSLKAQFPNLVDYEAQLAFKQFHPADALPDEGTPVADVRVRRSWYGGVERKSFTRGFQRSDDDCQAHRGRLRIGMPRVLNMYSTGPFWRTYFEALGVASRNIVFSDPTSPEMWEAGGRYGSIDPCFPSKVVQAHIHDLLFAKHVKAPLDFIFFPCLTHLPSFVEGMPDSTACPIVAGAPKVMRAAFTKEGDHFARAGVEFVDPALTLTEPCYLKRQMFDAWGPRLRVSSDESDFAVGQAFAAMRRFDAEMQRRGLLLLEQLEQENRVGILVLGRPYHNDPGLNHDVLDEFQALGYPLLSIRSIPKDAQWLRRFFAQGPDGMAPLAISDVWPEAYSTNSAEKVWAAKFAARHPNLVVLDFSSFKCGHDAPTYGMIDSIISASGTPYAALHDIDANKPGGSIKIRVRTYEHALRRHADRLQELKASRTELQCLVDAKRQELQARRNAAAAVDAAMDLAYAECQGAEKAVRLGPVEPRENRACESSMPAQPSIKPITIHRQRSRI